MDEEEGAIEHCKICGYDYYTDSPHECPACGDCYPNCVCDEGAMRA
jgi:rubrerythrin